MLAHISPSKSEKSIEIASGDKYSSFISMIISRNRLLFNSFKIARLHKQDDGLKSTDSSTAYSKF